MPADNRRLRSLILEILLIVVILAGLYLRVVGPVWDEGQYLHPDERFLMFVESSIQPVKSFGEYFDTATSTLNPHNVGHPFFVYGTFPIFVVRYLLQFLEMSGSDAYVLGRPLSALLNTLTVFLAYLIGARAYNRRIGLLGAAFAAFSVLPIQLSHYFKEDTFMVFFSTLALYLAVVIATGGSKDRAEPDLEVAESSPPPVAEEFEPPAEADRTEITPQSPARFRSQLLVFIFFGLAVGMAMASKVNSAPVAFVLPLAVLIRISRLPSAARGRALLESILYLVISGAAAFITFRLLQPYAFSGPGLLGLIPNPEWLGDIRELQGITSPEAQFGFPPAVQWADRPVWFALENIIRWGLGIPLGILAWVGFLWVGWRILRGEWRTHILLWSFTGLYFLWQSSVFNPSMRYQLPIYPTLALYAAWAVVTVWDTRISQASRFWLVRNWPKALAGAVGGVVLIGTVVWAFAFTSIYRKPVTRLEASRWIFENVPGPINLTIESGGADRYHPLPFTSLERIDPGQPFVTTLIPTKSGELTGIYLHRLVDYQAREGVERIRATVTPGDAPDTVLAAGEAVFDLSPDPRASGQPLTIPFDTPVTLDPEKVYQLILSLESENTASLGISGSALANESSWDDALPYRVDGFDGYGGIYEGDLNFEMYWEDSPEKLERFVSVLDQAEYLMISSNRQWGSVGRLPGRYPISTSYYRLLLGCPEPLSVPDCYNDALPGTDQGELGFDLIRVFESDPELGPIHVNDQSSEEAFTVYDHPKVFIFKKSDGFDPAMARSQLESAYFASLGSSSDAPAAPAKDLLLPEDRLAGQVEGGTWNDLFNTESLINRYPWLGAAVWYIALGLVGLVAFPLVRAVLPGLDDHGLPIARAAGLLILSYLVWLAGSFNIPFTRTAITVAFLAIGLTSAVAAYRSRRELREEWRSSYKYILVVEGLFLGIFVLGLLIRYANPDLWHPWKGGEKPMDFSYFNAVLKSTTFPPYDPWFAGGYINYYYFGFVYAGVLVKWLGVQPSVAYNLVIPTLFAMIALGAFSMGWNLFRSVRPQRQENTEIPEADVGPPDSDSSPPLDSFPSQASPPPDPEHPAGVVSSRAGPWLAGTAAMLGMAILGNLGIIAMFIRGYQSLASGGAILEEAGLLTRALWTVRGFFQALSGTPLPYGIADWYWIPSRAIPAPNDVEPITEFPMFTVLYADLHAHLIVLPIALLAIAWALSVILTGGRWRGWLAGIGGFLFGGLAIGALRPTNTWDFYPYLALGMLAVGYALVRNFKPPGWSWADSRNVRRAFRIGAALGGMLLLAVLAHLLFQPYAQWYGQGYNAVDYWRGGHTTITAYLVHWGLFLFVIITWLIWETRQWMASTPMSALRRFEPYRGLMIFLIVLVAVWIGGMILLKVNVSLLAIPLAIWAGLLILRPGMPDAKRAVLFIVGTGLMLTLMVEVVVLRGDIGRMNTVFKFYLQVWTFFSIASAAALGWLFLEFPSWKPGWRKGWQLALAVIVGAAALYPVLGGLAKVRDRMTESAPLTLDGMEYMNYSRYFDLETELDLSQDFGAIRWLQENVEGSPVIVEGNMVEYHWGSRFSIYTGLPGVLGWNWHQRQQRAVLAAPVVEERLAEINAFYETRDEAESRAFLDRYGVRYIVLGQLERALYSAEGLSKFPVLDGRLWTEVYSDRDTSIYQVIPDLSQASS